MITTACGHLVFVRRAAAAGSHPGWVGPTVSGNLDFGSNGRPSRDLDPMGMPDPIRALVRESHEELGIILEPQHVTTCGLGTFSNPREVNSNLLFCVAPADLSLPDLPSVTRYADLVEGAWEVGGKAVALRLPRNEDETSRAIDWLVGSTELTPQATLAGLGALGCLNDVDDIFQRASRNQVVTTPWSGPPTWSWKST